LAPLSAGILVCILGCIVLWAALPIPAAAADGSAPLLDTLVARSTDIVQGRVVSRSSAWNEDRTQIVTELEIAVDQSLAGEAVLRLRLTHPGGQVGDILQWSPHSTSFTIDEPAVFFIERIDDGFRLADFRNGKLPLERDGDGRLWVPSTVVQRYAPGLVAAGSPFETEGNLDALGRLAWPSFAAELRRRIAQGPETGLQRRQAPSRIPGPARGEPTSGQSGVQSDEEPLRQATSQTVAGLGFNVSGYKTGGELATRCPHEPTPTAHWDLRAFPSCRVPYEINAGHNNWAIDESDFVNEVHAAAAKWNNVSPAHIALFDNDTDSDCVPKTRDNRNCVSWLRSFPWPADIIATTWLWTEASSGRLLEADIFLDPVETWTVTPSPLPSPCPDVPGIQSTLIHEFGHFVGLDHPDEPENAAECPVKDPGGVTKMHSESTSLCQLTLHTADRDGINYLYSQDLGDLPDLPYPTLVHQSVNAGRTLSGVALQTPNDGPSHLFGFYGSSGPRYQYEWLAFGSGAIDDHAGECEAVAKDKFDDGVVVNYDCEDGEIEGMVKVLISVKTAADVRGKRHTYDADNRMYLNGWFDWDGDGDFGGTLEHAIGEPPFAIMAQGQYAFEFLPPAGARCEFASRFRLDWREDVGRTRKIDSTLSLERGAAQHGEVEDYPVPPPTQPPPTTVPGDPPGDKREYPIPVYCHPKMVLIVFTTGAGVSLLDLCHPPQVADPSTVPAAALFPDAGSECMPSTMTVGIDLDLDGVAEEGVGLTGEVCVQRTDPFEGPDGFRRIQTEMTGLEMSGYSELAGEIRIVLADSSFGEIVQSPEAFEAGYDVSGEAPASSYFDVSFVVESDEFGSSEPVTIRVEGEIGQVPPGEVLVEPVPTGEGFPPDEEAPDGELP